MFRVSYIVGMMNGLPSSMKHSVKHILKLQSQSSDGVPKGHVAVYVGELGKKSYVVPVAYLNHPLFKVLLKSAEEEFGFNHPMGGLTIPCKEETFISLTYELGIARLQR